jgi:hypothetical protein
LTTASPARAPRRSLDRKRHMVEPSELPSPKR